MFCGPASICSRVTALHELGVVVDLERAEALGAGVLGDQAEGRAAVAAHQAAGGVRRGRAAGRRVGLGGTGSGQSHATTTSSSSPRRAVEPRGTELAPSAARCAGGGCRGFIGPCPSAPLDEWNAVNCTQSGGRPGAGQDVRCDRPHRLHRPRRHDGRPAGLVLAHRRPGADRRSGRRAARPAPRRRPVGAGQRPDVRAGDRGRPDLRRGRRHRRAGRHGRPGTPAGRAPAPRRAPRAGSATGRRWP